MYIAKFNMEHAEYLGRIGKKLRSFGTRGSGHGQFKELRAVSVDGERNILAADSTNNRIQKFMAEGQFLATYGDGPMQLNHPTDIAFNTSNSKVYVPNHQNHLIQVLNSDLTFSSTFRNKGSHKGQFDGPWPWGIVCDITGKVYVADLYNHRIQVFTAEGALILLGCLGGVVRVKGNWIPFSMLQLIQVAWCMSMSKATIVSLCLPQRDSLPD